ncbi:hypothetical protein QYM36_012613, partial [Artemia franciscana]
ILPPPLQQFFFHGRAQLGTHLFYIVLLADLLFYPMIIYSSPEVSCLTILLWNAIRPAPFRCPRVFP